jgi:hypothetical protein
LIKAKQEEKREKKKKKRKMELELPCLVEGVRDEHCHFAKGPRAPLSCS